MESLGTAEPGAEVDEYCPTVRDDERVGKRNEVESTRRRRRQGGGDEDEDEETRR